MNENHQRHLLVTVKHRARVVRGRRPSGHEQKRAHACDQWSFHRLLSLATLSPIIKHHGASVIAFARSLLDGLLECLFGEHLPIRTSQRYEEAAFLAAP